MKSNHKCSACGQEKPLKEFPRVKQTGKLYCNDCLYEQSVALLKDNTFVNKLTAIPDEEIVGEHEEINIPTHGKDIKPPTKIRDRREVKLCAYCGRWLLDRSKLRLFCDNRCKKNYRDDIELAYKKKRSKCVLCGYSKHTTVLHLHHLKPEEKKFAITQTRSYCFPIDDVYREIEKCIPLCPTCHAEVHLGFVEI